MSIRDEILAKKILPIETVDVPEWDMKVKVRGLMGFERDAFEASTMEGRGCSISGWRWRWG